MTVEQAATRLRSWGYAEMPESPEDRQSELESLWYEIAQAIAAGRTQGLVCPECLSEGLEVEEQRGRTSVRCPNCKRFVEVGIATA